MPTHTVYYTPFIYIFHLPIRDKQCMSTLRCIINVIDTLTSEMVQF